LIILLNCRNLSNSKSQNFSSNLTKDKSSKGLKKNFGSGSPTYSFGGAERVKKSMVDYMNNSCVVSNKIKNLPGPGNYNPNTEYVKKRTSSAWR